MMVPRARPRVVLLTLFAVAVPVHAGQNPVFDVARCAARRRRRSRFQG